jgi:hypothetical protein
MGMSLGMTESQFVAAETARGRDGARVHPMEMSASIKRAVEQMVADRTYQEQNARTSQQGFSPFGGF